MNHGDTTVRARTRRAHGIRPATEQEASIQREAMRLIFTRIAQAYGVRYEDLVSTRRLSRCVSMARHVAIWATAQLTTCLFEDIARSCGSRTRQSAIQARDRIDKLVAEDELEQESLKLIIETLQSVLMRHGLPVVPQSRTV